MKKLYILCILFVALVLSSALVAMAKPTDYHVVTYRVENDGDGNVASITYNDERGDQNQDTEARLPWSKTLRMERGTALFLSAQNVDEHAKRIKTTISIDGRIEKTNTANGKWAVSTCKIDKW